MQEEEEAEEEEEDITNTDEGASCWLETLGIDKAKYRSLDPSKIKLYPFTITRSINI